MACCDLTGYILETGGGDVTMAMGERSDRAGDPVSLKQLSMSLIPTKSFVVLGGGATM